MRSLLLTLCLVIAGSAGASGSNTVFHKIESYQLTFKIPDSGSLPHISPYPEHMEERVYFVQLERESWYEITESLRLGYNVIAQICDTRLVYIHSKQQSAALVGRSPGGAIFIITPQN